MVARKRHKKPKQELLSRAGGISDWGGSLFLFADRHGVDDLRRSMLSLDLKGTFLEAVRGTTAFELRVVPEETPTLGKAEIPSVGVFSSAKPALTGSVYLNKTEFDLVMAMATAGKLVSVHMTFQTPHYGTALIASISFSSDPPDA